jgi:hypothetical protein
MGFFICERFISPVKKIKLISGKMPYIMLRGHWCDIIVLNVHALTENKSDDTKDSFHMELECVFVHFMKYDMKILLGALNAMQK